MYTTYLEVVKGNNVLESTNMLDLMNFFGKLMGKPTDTFWNDYEHANDMLSLVGSYHAALVNRGIRRSNQSINSVDIDALNKFQRKLFTYILIDLAYRIYQGSNPVILKSLACTLENEARYTECTSYDELFSSMYNNNEFKFFNVRNWAKMIREYLIGASLVVSPSRVDIIQMKDKRLEIINQKLDEIEGITFDFSGHNAITPLCLVRYLVNRIIYKE